jgi:hypothetical protein
MTLLTELISFVCEDYVVFRVLLLASLTLAIVTGVTV